MFKFLKEKLSNAISKFTKSVSKEVKEPEETPEEPEVLPEKKKPAPKKESKKPKPKETKESKKKNIAEEKKVKKPKPKKTSKPKEAAISEEPKEKPIEETKEEITEEPEIKEPEVEPEEEIKEEPKTTKEIKEEPVVETKVEPVDEIKVEEETKEEPAEKEEEKKESFFDKIKRGFGFDKEEGEEKPKEEVVTPEAEEAEPETKEVEEKPKVKETETPEKEPKKPAEEREEVQQPEIPDEEEPKKADAEEKEEEAEQPEITGTKVETKPPEKQELDDVSKYEEKEDKGIFAKIGDTFTKKKLSADKFNDIFFELEVALLENNVAVEVVDKIRSDLSEAIVDKPLPKNKISYIILDTLKKSIIELFENNKSIDLVKEIKDHDKPYVILFLGVNGSGKTTTIAKLAKYLENNGLSSVISASDTFRAASIEQLQNHADKLNVKLIKHDYGSDAAAVAFDAISYAKSKDIDCVLIDTAGRLHSNTNLMDELKKVSRVAQPQLKVFVGESITGNDCVEQSQTFNEAVEIDGIILSKADIDEKGGTALSVSFVTKKPILFLGMGQEYNDLEPFKADRIMNNLGLA